ncbi:hypothetical protein, partial [Acutalibacter muris]|uniref:hypothetical protein n=1 Tax=Acutalibacter muris TaxID=1796620 RepID=UPI001C3EF874
VHFGLLSPFFSWKKNKDKPESPRNHWDFRFVLIIRESPGKSLQAQGLSGLLYYMLVCFPLHFPFIDSERS